MDGAIVVRGEASPVEPRSPVFVTQTHVRLQSGLEVEIVNVHLEAPVVRFDLSSGDVWRDHTVKRQVHRRQMEEIAARMASVPREMPLIVGGDFNEPAGDAVLAPLKTRLCDTFREAGLGWGNTVVNEFPVLRIDQVWVSDHFRVAAVAARRTQHSDHRMVICDLVAREPARPQSPAPG
jgi:endonuclease/exonuclease/phosphatase (EEP) superfamily protein YafD